MTNRLTTEGNTRHSEARVASGANTGTAVSGNASLPHVLFLIDELREPGGTERVLLNTIRLLPRDRFRCSVATFKLDSSVEIFKHIGCPTHVFPIRRTYGLTGLRTAGKLRHLIRSQNVQIVHTFFETADLWGAVVAKLSGCPVVISSRRDMGIMRSLKHRRAYRVTAPFVDHVLAVAEQVRTFCIQEDHLDPGKVSTLYNGLDIEKFSGDSDRAAVRAELGIPDASHVIVTVGHIRKVKGIDTLVRAAAIVCREFSQASFVVVGDVNEPEHFREIQALAKELGVAANFKFPGSSERVARLLRSSDIFCLPSRSEGFSNALVEAMACAMPCVATLVGGNGEAIEESVSGFLVPPEDPQALALRLLHLMHDPVRAREMGAAARKTVEIRFTEDAMIGGLMRVYDGLLAAKNSAYGSSASAARWSANATAESLKGR